MATLIMVRTQCCETFKCSGVRCANCPHRPENEASVQAYLQQSNSMRFGRLGRPTPPESAPVPTAGR
ncbi:MAG: hypothetical protein JNL98_30640 [Bryobacterales bacterium]|nr:hypothetical protein [Bryobacterales bacterium]